MKFGLLFRPQDPPNAENIGRRWQETLDAAQAAEEAGFDGVFVPESASNAAIRSRLTTWKPFSSTWWGVNVAAVFFLQVRQFLCDRRLLLLALFLCLPVALAGAIRWGGGFTPGRGIKERQSPELR